MPKKVQLKLLSSSGELLNVVSCHAGQVTVFRAHSSSDLRPYQRALGGTPGKERLTVSIDGSEYTPEDHNLVGLGETPPHVGMTVEEFFNDNQISSQNASALLNSFGLTFALTTPCNQLSPDDERRMRLLVATCTPDKILVLNEPFENISSQWREQFAQLLSSFARQRGGLVIVTALSYRPDCWIDNDSIARIQVGENIQRTIGFGASGSKSTDLMNQLRDAVRSDMGEQPQPSMNVNSTVVATGLLAAAHSSRNTDTSEREPSSGESAHLSQSASAASMRSKLDALGGISALKMPIILSIVGITCASISVGLLTKNSDTNPSQPAQHQEVGGENNSEPTIARGSETTPSANSVQTGNGAPPTTTKTTVEPPKLDNILDGYPETVKISLLETARGNVVSVGEPSSETAQASQTNFKSPQKSSDSGNLFKLLESASSKTEYKAQTSNESQGDESSTTWQAPPNDAPVEEVDPSEEQQRREAIRQKFLDAIRAAAEKRQASMDDTGT